ncbi:hypothetical protein C8R43DRAFT_1131951 [Mycena crocata]|nr:hypothetical protein C8R43DRAFT_1131951 [Mycena crocata]
MIAVGALLEFRSKTIPPAFITANPGGFVNLDWVHQDALRVFLRARNPVNSMPLTIGSVKTEPSDSFPPTRSEQRPHIKSEFIDLSSLPTSPVAAPVKTVTLVEDDVEIIEILSSEDEMEVEQSLRPSGASSDLPEPSHIFESSDSDDDSEFGAIDGVANINRQTKVDRVEYMNGLPPYWPIPRVKTAYVVDLRDPKFDFVDGNGELLRADALILDKDQDSWDTTGGGGDQHPSCLLFTGEKVLCRRARHRCNGCLRCSELDPALVNVTRYELDPTSRTADINAEIATRQEEGDTPEKLAAAFYRSITSKEKKCKALDNMGAPCLGDYMMKRRKDGTQRKGHFIACSQWTPVWRGHNSFNIRDEVDETLLAQLFSDAEAFTSGSETAACSRIISPRTGERQKFCAHIHLRQGKSVRSDMIHHPCNAYMTIFVPVDPSLRMACVVLDHRRPHTHPMPPMKKASLDVKKVYRRCVKAMGALGTTVQKVDDAPTTLLLLKGQSPAMFHPSLHCKRLKQTVIRDEKLLASAAGLGFEGE